MTSQVLKSLALGAIAMFAVGAQAALEHDKNVTNAVITGSGINNGGFTVERAGGVEVGLRARERYDLATNSPTQVTGSNGLGSFNQNAGEPPGFPTSNRARWNFDWSINTDMSGTSGNKVNSFTYRLGMDFDAGFGTNYQIFNPINGVTTCADHSFGDNTTVQSAGVEVQGNPIGGANKCGVANIAADSAQYASLLASNNLVQQSWNYDFFDGGSFPFDPNANGNYSIFLEVIGANGQVVARSDIEVIVGTGAVPEPGVLALSGLALAGLAATRRRRQQG